MSALTKFQEIVAAACPQRGGPALRRGRLGGQLLPPGSGSSRRVWVVECTERVSLKLLERDRDQLWAEAVAMLTKEMRS